MAHKAKEGKERHRWGTDKMKDAHDRDIQVISVQDLMSPVPCLSP